MSLFSGLLMPKAISGILTTDTILHIDDSEVDHEALKRAHKRIGSKASLFWCTDVKDAQDFLSHEGRYQLDGVQAPRPTIILLDLNMPGEDGRSLLKQLKKKPEFSSIPVVILTSSSNPKDVEECYASGANAYLVKPMDPKDLDLIVLSFTYFWLKHTILPRRSLKTIEKKGTSNWSHE